MDQQSPADEISEKIRQLYTDHTAIEISKILEISIYKVRNKAYSMGLRKDIEWIRENARKNILSNPEHPARKCQFKKGHNSANKGKKLREYCSPETVEKILQTTFKKNHVPANHKEVGYERVSVDGYIERKVAEPNKFRLLHRIIWEEHNGPIAKGYNIQFKDGNRQNCTIENLYIISRSDQLKNENSFHARYPEEIKMAIHAKAALTRNINRIIKEETNE